MFDAYLSLVYFVAALVVVYILAPGFVLGRQADLAPVERLWCAFLFGSAYWMGLILVLAPIHFNDIPGIFATSLFLFLAYQAVIHRVNIRSVTQEFFLRCVTLFFDLLEGHGALTLRRETMIQVGTRSYWRRVLGRWDLPRMLPWALFLYAACRGLHDPLTHYSLVSSSSQTDLLWLKQLDIGSPFEGGLAPRGFHAFLACLGTLSGLDHAVLIRFTGGFLGAVLPVALYFFLLECRLPWTGALVGAALLVAFPSFHGSISAMAVPLAEEFALFLMLLSLAFGLRCLRLERARDRWAFFCGSFAVWSSDSLVGVAVLLSLLPVGLDCLGRRPLRWFFRLGREAVAAMAAGCLFLLVGWRLGYAFPESSDVLSASGLSPSGIDLSIQVDLAQTLYNRLGPAGSILLVGAVLIAIYGLLRRREPFPSPAFLGLWALALAALGTLDLWSGASVLPERLAAFLPLAASGAAAWLYTLVLEPVLGKWITIRPLRALFASLAVAAILWQFYTPPREPIHPQYEEAARLYYDLISELPRGSWTVVGQAEDYALIRNRGYFMNIPSLLGAYPPYKVSLHLPTPYMFLIVEKKPREPDGTPSQERELEESLLVDWIHIYALHHRDLHLYQETPDVAIYVLRQPGTAPAGEFVVQ